MQFPKGLYTLHGSKEGAHWKMHIVSKHYGGLNCPRSLRAGKTLTSFVIEIVEYWRTLSCNGMIHQHLPVPDYTRL